MTDEPEKIIRAFSEELKGLRAGRATPALVEHIMVNAYGSKMPLKGVAAITVPGGQSIEIEPWDASLLKAIEEAIETSSLGLKPMAERNKLRLNIPPLTQERRRELARAVSEKAEEARVKLRRVREVERERMIAQERSKKISEDEKFRQLKKLDEQMNEWQEKVEAARKEKEEEILG
ncbi:MAG: ribosome recycling factor [bacterium]|nr:ribosome recycling factor [bacterium]MDZ4295921.1 ribosome recycling factor [Patescibacteria group bacterium]